MSTETEFVLLSPDKPKPYRHLHPLIEMRDSGIAGKGIFAIGFIKTGETVWDSPPSLALEGSPGTMAISEIEKLSDEKKKWYLHYAYQVGKDRFNGPANEGDTCLDEDFSSYYNHSCDPNTWFTTDTTLVACRDIQPGEEITYDYGTSETYHLKFSECLCGTPSCRKTLTPNDWQRSDFQQRYGNHVMSYVRELIEEYCLAKQVANDQFVE